MREKCKSQDCEKPSVYETVDGDRLCEMHAHNISHFYRLHENQIPCPVLENGKVVPYGRYPNIDWG